MGKYRKKPIVVEAVQFTGAHVRGICVRTDCYLDDSDKIHVHTIHNNQRVNVEKGDWIIPEPDGVHFYPVKPDIFAATYEEAPSDA